MRGKRLLRAALPALLILVIAGPPWPPARQAFSSGYCAVLNGLFGSATFGKGGQVLFVAGEAARDGRRPTGEVTVDAVLEVSVIGYRGSLVQGLNLRRDAYLPLVVVLAAMAAIPIDRRRKLRLLAAGTAIEIGVILASIWLVLVWDFAVGLNLRGIYVLSPLWKDALDLAFRTLLLPPANRVVIPIAIAALLAWRNREHLVIDGLAHPADQAALRPAVFEAGAPPGR